MSYKRWMDNAFWETDEKKELNCILELEDDVGRVTRQQMFLSRHDKDGSENELFNEVVEALGEQRIDEETEAVSFVRRQRQKKKRYVKKNIKRHVS